MKKFCEICGKPSGIYPLCRDCFKLRDEGKVIKCEECGKWHYSDTLCECQKKTFTELPLSGFTECIVCGEPTTGYAFCRKCFNKHTKEELLDILNNNYQDTKKSNSKLDFDEIKLQNDQDKQENQDIKKENEKTSSCLICGEESNGYLFCKTCYYKYRNKTILLKITQCNEIELLDDTYEGKYTCADGHIVKSKSELAIDNYLYYHNIQHAYEKALPIDGEKSHDLHPDFYLPELNLYIEHWGFDESNLDYCDKKEYKLLKYTEKGITLICTNEKDMSDIDAALDRKLDPTIYKKNQINFNE